MDRASLTRIACALLAAGLLWGCTPSSARTDDSAAAAITLERVTSGLTDPVHLTSLPGDPRLFIVEQPGRIRVYENGRTRSDPFLDITSRVRAGGERGLLSLAFHPRFADNGYLFVNYTDRGGRTVVERYRSRPDRQSADPASARTVLTVEQPYSNHNGGHILFGPDGMLYVGMGDGGAANDPHGHGQNAETLLGALLRIDVDGADPYAIPQDNPFAAGGGRPEIWAIGLRNPWRMAFDDSLLYIADVGQNRWEEIHVARSGAAGLHYGWNVLEGSNCFRARDCDRTGLELPAVEYDHDEGCSVTGGLVYRGSAIPALAGHYVYSDYCRGWIRSFRFEGGRAVDATEWPVPRAGSISSFGAGADGELYVVTLEGDVFRIVPAGDE